MIWYDCESHDPHKQDWYEQGGESFMIDEFTQTLLDDMEKPQQ
jgi:hypothetical protein